jgi:hypothetical protein
MDRRKFNALSSSMLAGLMLAAHGRANALSLADLSNTDATKGLKTALEKGAISAIGLLGATDGFLGNDKVRIPLPHFLDEAAKLMRTFGQGGRIEELTTAMNRGAEAAVPMAKDLLVKAIQTMSVQDAKGLLSGGETAITQFFAQKTREPLAVKFQPVVTRATAKVQLADKYNQVAGKALELGLIQPQESNINQYVTGKALDGLYFMIGEEEKNIRKNPVGYGSSILSKVFGASL